MNVDKIREYFIGLANKVGLYSFLRSIWKKFFKKYAMAYQSRIFNANANPVLKKLGKALDDEGIEAWLTFGTLLGYVREGDFIKHDNDIDFALLLNDKNRTLESMISKHGFTKVREIMIEGGEYGLEQTYEMNGVLIDFFFVRDEGDFYLYHSFNAIDGFSIKQTIEKFGGLKTTEATFTPSPLKKVAFKDSEFFIPVNYDIFLRECYGDDYMVPNKDWSPEDASNIVDIDRLGVETLSL